MIEFGLIFVGGIGVLTIIQNVVKNLWLTFKWSVLGWPPRIFDEAMVSKTIERCARMQVESEIAELKLRGMQFTQAEEDNFLTQTKANMRTVIAQYIDYLSRK